MTVEKGLLMHWWHYYGKDIYTLEEMETFSEIIDTYGVDKVIDAGVASFIAGDGSPQVILSCIRTNSIEEMFETLPNFAEMEEHEKQAYEKIKQVFIEAISVEYNK